MKKKKLFLFTLMVLFVVGFAVNVNAEGEGLTIDSLTSKKFSGSTIKPTFTNKVKYDGISLAADAYDVTYSVDNSVENNNAMLEDGLPFNAGIYVVTVKYTPEGGTEQTAVGSFEVTKYQVKIDTQKAMATLTDLSESKEVDAEVYWLKSSKRQVLTKGVDYTVSYTYKTADGEETTPDLLVQGDKVVINVTMINGNFSNNSGTATVQHATASAVKDGVTTYYNNIGNATSYAESGSIINMLENYERGALLNIKDKSFVLDLNGHTLTIVGNSSAGVVFENYDEPGKITLTIKNGTIKNTVEGQWGVKLENHYVNNGGVVELTLAKDLVIEAPYGIMFDQDYSLGTTVNVYSKVIGSITGLYLTGVQTSVENAPVINIGEDADISGIDGAYIAGYAKMTVADGAKISGTAAAVEIRAGELTINGGTFTSTYDGEAVVVTPNGSGSTTQGAAIAVAQHNTALPINVTINGGTFNGVAAVYESNPQENSAEDIAKIEMAISGGTFNSTSDTVVYSEDFENFITGGVYSAAPASEYIAVGYEANNDGTGEYVILSGLKAENITLSKTTYEYTGKAITPSVVVKYGDKTLVKGTDYTVTYKNNVKVGTATVVVTGKGNYSGSVSKTFTITPLKFTIDNTQMNNLVVNKTYTTKAVKQNITFVCNGKTLKAGTDYVVTYENNVNIGKAIISVIGKGNYAGKIRRSFYIKPVKIGIKNITTSGNSFTVSYYAAAGGVKYQVAYKQAGNKTWKFANTTKTSYKARYLKYNTKYYLKVRPYKVVDGLTFYGAWSDVKNKTIRK